MNNIWLIILGLILVFFELLFGAISGFDIALIGLSLTLGGLVHYYTISWQLGIVISISIILFYFTYFRKKIRKKLLLATQAIGIDSLLGKTAIVIKSITRQQDGKVLLDGEVWSASAKNSFEEGKEVVVERVNQATLTVNKQEKL